MRWRSAHPHCSMPSHQRHTCAMRREAQASSVPRGGAGVAHTSHHLVGREHCVRLHIRQAHRHCLLSPQVVSGDSPRSPCRRENSTPPGVEEWRARQNAGIVETFCARKIRSPSDDPTPTVSYADHWPLRRPRPLTADRRRLCINPAENRPVTRPNSARVNVAVDDGEEAGAHQKLTSSGSGEQA